jgi:hypothetical protein
MKRILLFLIIGSLLSSCGLRTTTTSESIIPTVELTATPEPLLPPTQTPAPTFTATVTPTPDLGTLGWLGESAGTVAYDFADQMCAAQWYTRGESLPCPGDASQAEHGYVMRFAGEAQGVSSGFPTLLTFPPLVHYSAISSTYPAFTVQRKDRFRAVLACQAHSYCDVEFVLSYFHGHKHIDLGRWYHLFNDAPVVVDYSLDNLAGSTVQFDLEVVGQVKRSDAFAVWVAPHIYRPVP